MQLLRVYLKMQMRPRCAAGVADVGDDLPGFDLLAHRDADAGAVRVQRRQPAAVVELDVVTVAAAPAVRALATVTVPSAAAKIGVPSGTVMSVPLW